MNLVLIDTSAWIEALRRQGNANIRERVRHLLTEDRACWNELIIAELWNGAQGAAEKKMIRALENDLLVFSINADVWQLVYKLAENARTQGKTVPTTDVIVFACSRHYKTELFHNDSHFELLLNLHS